MEHIITKDEIDNVPPLRYMVDTGCPISVPIKPPVYPGDVGYDLGVAIHGESMILPPHEFIDLPTYVRVELPPETWGDIRPRSSTFSKRKLVVLGGTIDNGYRGLLSVFVFNPNPINITIRQGDYLAQLVLHPILRSKLERATTLSPTIRGSKGFGSSGGYQEPPPSPQYNCMSCQDTGVVGQGAGSGMIGYAMIPCPACSVVK